MARSDRKLDDFTTGLASLDELLNGVRPGDNIVWQVDSPADYVPLVHPFCAAAARTNRKMIYFRFADHEYLLPPRVPAEVYHLKASGQANWSKLEEFLDRKRRGEQPTLREYLDRYQCC